MYVLLAPDWINNTLPRDVESRTPVGSEVQPKRKVTELDLRLHPKISRSVTIASLLIVFLFSYCYESPPSHTAPVENTDTRLTSQTMIWQGFRHGWTYNHRLHRLGDFVRIDTRSDSTIKAEHYHTAATGFGQDVATFTSYYTFAHLNGIESMQDKISLQLAGKRGTVAADTHTVRIPLPASSSGQKKVIAFLNGFDLYTSQNAFKIESLNIELVDAEIDPSSGEIAVSLTGAIQMDCRSIECKKFDTDYSYTMTVHFVVLVGGRSVRSNSRQFTERYTWDKFDELQIPVRSHTLTGVPDPTLKHAFLAFRRLSVDLDGEHWFIDWNTFLVPDTYEAERGEYRFRLGLMLREWRKGMKFQSAQPTESLFSLRGGGAGEILADVMVVQFKEGCVAHDSIRGQIDWKRREKKHDSSQSILRQALRWNDECTKMISGD